MPQKTFIIKRIERLIAYICLGLWVIGILGGVLGFLFFWENCGFSHLLEIWFYSTLGVLLGYAIFKIPFKKGMLGTRIYIEEKKLIYRKKEIPLEKIYHLSVVIQESKLNLGANLFFKIVYEANGEEKSTSIPMGESMFPPYYSGLPRELPQELINRRGTKGVSQEVFEFIETGKVQKWEEYITRTKVKSSLNLLWILSIVFFVVGGAVRFLGYLCLLAAIILFARKSIKDRKLKERKERSLYHAI